MTDTERDPVRAALERLIPTIRSVDPETTEAIAIAEAALRFPLPGRLDCGGALKSLSNEISGWLSAYEPDLRAAMGNTNFAVMEHKLAEANVALLKTDVEYHRGYAAGVADQIETQEYDRNIAEALSPTLNSGAAGEPVAWQPGKSIEDRARDLLEVEFKNDPAQPTMAALRAVAVALRGELKCIDALRAVWDDWITANDESGMDEYEVKDTSPETVQKVQSALRGRIFALPRAVDGGAGDLDEVALSAALEIEQLDWGHPTQRTAGIQKIIAQALRGLAVPSTEGGGK